MDVLIAILVPVVVLSAGAAYAAWAIYRFVRFRRIWRETAESNDFEYSPGFLGGLFGDYELRGERKGVPVEVSTRKEGWKFKEYYTDYRALLPGDVETTHGRDDLPDAPDLLDRPGTAYQVTDGVVAFTDSGFAENRAELQRNIDRVAKFCLEVEEALETEGDDVEPAAAESAEIATRAPGKSGGTASAEW